MRRMTIVDIGSNSVKCNVYELEPSMKLLLSQSRTLGLIRYIEQERLGERGRAILVETVRDFTEYSAAFGCAQTVCVATASLRGLKNCEEIVSMINALGCRMAVISAEEEARLGFRALSAGRVMSGRGIVLDMGGASTELSAFEDGRVCEFVSLPLGCLALYRDHVHRILPSKEERHAIVSEVKARLDDLPWLKEYGEQLYMIGGSAKMLCRILAQRSGRTYEDGMQVSREELEALCRAYRDPGKKHIGAMIDAAPDRLHTFVPALLAYRTIAREAMTEGLTLSFATLREGLARMQAEDGREDGHA